MHAEVICFVVASLFTSINFLLWKQIKYIKYCNTFKEHENIIITWFSSLPRSLLASISAAVHGGPFFSAKVQKMSAAPSTLYEVCKYVAEPTVLMILITFIN